MSSNLLTFGAMAFLVLFGFGMWGNIKGNIDLRHKKAEETRITMSPDIPDEISIAEKRIQRSILISKGVMIAGLAGLFITLSKIDKKTFNTKPGERYNTKRNYKNR